MRRVTQDEIEMIVYVAIKVAPGPIKNKLRTSNPSESDAAAEKLAKNIAAQLSNGSLAVFEADRVCQGDSGLLPGRWGVNEPGV